MKQIQDVNNIRLTLHFNLSEFESPDTGEVMIHPDIVWKLEALRQLINTPITVTSGYRTEDRNSAVNGHPNSAHMVGCAVDITFKDIGTTFLVVEEWCKGLGFRRVKYYHDRKFFHLAI